MRSSARSCHPFFCRIRILSHVSVLFHALSACISIFAVFRCHSCHVSRHPSVPIASDPGPSSPWLRLRIRLILPCFPFLITPSPSLPVRFRSDPIPFPAQVTPRPFGCTRSDPLIRISRPVPLPFPSARQHPFQLSIPDQPVPGTRSVPVVSDHLGPFRFSHTQKQRPTS